MTLAGGTGWNAPFRGSDNHHQQLYLAEDIDGAGYIYSIELRLNDAATGCNCPDATISMGHTQPRRFNRYLCR